MLLCFLCFSCNKSKENEKNSAVLTLKTTEYGGCFSKNQKSAKVSLSDVDYTINQDTISFNIDFNDNCGGKFVINNTMSHDSIYVSIADTSSRAAYCTCQFNMTNKYVGYSLGSIYHYNVYLKTMGSKNFVLYGSGDIVGK